MRNLCLSGCALVAFSFPGLCFANVGALDRDLHQETAQLPDGTIKVVYHVHSDGTWNQSKHGFHFYCSYSVTNTFLHRTITKPNGATTTVMDDQTWVRPDINASNMKNCGRALTENIQPAWANYSDLHSWPEVEADRSVVSQILGRPFDPYH